ncbi:uncharacterized protein LOC115087088 [Rhinatrema bivittatum]|uniref:uncharacterized protein LOC115087088 n=1 Tax=Rhinatrema bivittatum TaxID=194408 RepID=UPI00112B7164|nr:uncharacterized protein LOC115087088 [Rhinatrema bivittatum]
MVPEFCNLLEKSGAPSQNWDNNIIKKVFWEFSKDVDLIHHIFETYNSFASAEISQLMLRFPAALALRAGLLTWRDPLPALPQVPTLSTRVLYGCPQLSHGLRHHSSPRAGAQRPSLRRPRSPPSTCGAQPNLKTQVWEDFGRRPILTSLMQGQTRLFCSLVQAISYLGKEINKNKMKMIIMWRHCLSAATAAEEMLPNASCTSKPML